MNNIGISIIIPCYNTEHFLPLIMQDIFSQSYTEWEIILVNDGSVDNTIDVCYYFKNKFPDKIIVIDQENQGVSAARNNGIKDAKYEYLFFIDSDDKLYSSESLKNAMDFISQNNSSDIFQFQSLVKKNNDLIPIGNNKLKTCVCNTDDYYKTKYARGEVWNYIFRKSIIKNYNIRFPLNVRISEDQAFVYTYMSYCCSFAVYSENLYIYTSDNPTNSRSYSNVRKDVVHHINAIYSIVKHRKNESNRFIDERISMMILFYIKLLSNEQQDYKSLEMIFRDKIPFQFKYLANNKFVFTLFAYISSKIAISLYKMIAK